jgi:hypothetical protein
MKKRRLSLSHIKKREASCWNKKSGEKGPKPLAAAASPSLLPHTRSRKGSVERKVKAALFCFGFVVVGILVFFFLSLLFFVRSLSHLSPIVHVKTKKPKKLIITTAFFTAPGASASCSSR